MRRSRVLIAITGALLFSPMGLCAEYGYGDTVTMECRLGTVISPNWVIVGQAYSGPRFFNPHFPTRTYLTLTYLKGAPVGDCIEILGSSPIPSGWVKTLTKGDTGLDKQHYNLRYVIEKQCEADSPFGSDELPPVTYVPLDPDVASMDFHRAEKEKAQDGGGSAPAAWKPLPESLGNEP